MVMTALVAATLSERGPRMHCQLSMPMMEMQGALAVAA